VTDSPDHSTNEKRPLKVLIGVDTYPSDVNGAATFAARLAAGLSARGHEVRIASPSDSNYHGYREETHEGATLPIYRVRSYRWYPHDWLRYVWPWHARRYAGQILDDFKPDVVHTQSHIVLGRGFVHEAKARGIRVVATNHFMPENLTEHAPIPEFLKRKAEQIAWADAGRTYALVSAVTCPSPIAAGFLQREAHVPRVYAVSNGIKPALYRPDFSPKKENRIIFVGRITGEKHIDVLLRAFATLDPALEAKLDIVGGGDLLKSLTKMAGDLGIADRTTFTGYVEDEELRDMLSRSTVFVMPSIAELQSIATLEAMASALPIIGADAMALPHLIHNGENGYLFTPGDSVDLAEKLTTVLSLDDAGLDKLKRSSLSYVAAHDIDHTLELYEALYRGETVPDPITAASLDERAP
jgi:glycosyltransferase involved in cell wall biosynthesis